jgi:hypothetical protein
VVDLLKSWWAGDTYPLRRPVGEKIPPEEALDDEGTAEEPCGVQASIAAGPTNLGSRTVALVAAVGVACELTLSTGVRFPPLEEL